MIDVRIEGIDELNNQLENLAKSLDAEAVEPILLDGATIIADDARQRAPLGPTGNLKRGVVVKTLQRRQSSFGAKPEPAPSIAAIDYRIAPHAHLVERGTSKMGAKPFFRPAVDSNSFRVYQHVMDGLIKIIEGAAK